MNKYALVFRTGFKQESKTLLNTIVRSIGYIVIIYIFMQLWQYIYGGAGGGDVIPGFTLSMMIWYLIITETIMCSVPSRAVTRAMSDDIRSGKIAYQLVRPYNYYVYQMISQFAIAIFKALFLLSTGLILGFIFVGGIPNFSIYGLFFGLLSLVSGILIQCAVFALIGMLAFWVENSIPYAWIVSKFFFLFGLFFPPEIFGGWVQQVIIYSPMNAGMSGPARLFVNFSWGLCLETMLVQFGYLALFIVLGMIMFKRGAKKVNVYGG